MSDFAGVSIKVPGIVDEVGVDGRSEVEVFEELVEGETTCEEVEPVGGAGPPSSRLPDLCCTGTNRSWRNRKISTLRFDGRKMRTIVGLWYPTK